MRRLVGRDVLGALHAWGRPCRAHGDVPGTRAAGDVGPYHKCPRDRHAPVPPRRGNGMRRLVGRDVLGAPRAGNAHAARTGKFRGRGPPGTSAPTTNAPVSAMRPCRPRRGNGMRRLVGRDVLGAPRAGDVHAARTGTSMRARGRPCRAHGDVPGTRAAEDVGPYHKHPVAAMRPCRPRWGRDAPAGRARRPRRAVRRGRPCRAHGDVHAACMGTPRGTRAAGDIGPYHAISSQRMVIPEISMHPAGTVSW